MLKVHRFPFNMFAVNTYVVYDPDSKGAMLVDPGMISGHEEQQLDAYIVSMGLKIKYVVNTHMHFDHVMGNQWAEKRFGLTPMAHKADWPLGKQVQQQAAMFGVPGQYAAADHVEPIDENTVFTLGGEEIRVLHVPGHSPGSVVLYAPKSGFILAGDVLFNGGIGRTDLPGGSYHQLIQGIRTKLMTLPKDTVVYSGHGPSPTIGAES